jgi:hypothetical protein
LQEYALADAENCAKVPDNISDDEAVQFSHAQHPDRAYILTIECRQRCQPTYLLHLWLSSMY